MTWKCVVTENPLMALLKENFQIHEVAYGWRWDHLDRSKYEKAIFVSFLAISRLKNQDRRWICHCCVVFPLGLVIDLTSRCPKKSLLRWRIAPKCPNILISQMIQIGESSSSISDWFLLNTRITSLLFKWSLFCIFFAIHLLPRFDHWLQGLCGVWRCSRGDLTKGSFVGSFGDGFLE